MNSYLPRILLLHATVGAGHKRAAEALATAFREYQLGEARVENVLDYTPPAFHVAYEQSYLKLVDHAPQVWGYFYSHTDAKADLAKIGNSLRKMIEKVGARDLKKLLNNFMPDAIICTHFLPMEVLLRLKRKQRLAKPVYCVVTDVSAHIFWTYQDIDGYFVPTHYVRQQLIQRGVPANIIHTTGIPIDPTIAQPKDANAMRIHHGLPIDTPLLLLFGGGVPTEHIRTIATGLLNSGTEGTLVVVAGRNNALVAALADLSRSPTMDLRVLGFINYVDDLVAASDLVITKAGGLIMSEVLARGVPLIVIDPIPGQEEWNADFVVSSGAGVQLRMADSVAPTVCRLLKEPQTLGSMRANAMSIGHPRAALNIAEQVIDWLKNEVL